MSFSLLYYLTDPVLRAPTVGCMLMCLAASLVGVVAFIRKRSLLGEALSHASYPGVVFSVLIASLLFPSSEEAVAIGILIGAFVAAILGLLTINLLEQFLKVKSDAALCFVLSVFFGIGVLAASRIQTTHALWYKKIQLFLYGQAATMTDIHILIYAVLAALILLFIFLLYRPIEILNFDREFAKSIGVKVEVVDAWRFSIARLSCCDRDSQCRCCSDVGYAHRSSSGSKTVDRPPVDFICFGRMFWLDEWLFRKLSVGPAAPLAQ